MKKNNSQEKRPIIVRFAVHSYEINRHERADAFIFPANTSFNDFGHSLACEVAIKVGPEDYEYFNGRCAIEGSLNLSQGISESLIDSDSVDARLLKKPFRTLLTDTKSYHLIYRHFGADRARELLTALQDVAVTPDSSFLQRWENFLTSKIFTLAFVRSSEAYFAYRKANRIIEGLGFETADARQSFSAQLTGQGPKLKFDFLFDSNNFFRGRIAVIIGQNGSGKTASLSKLARALADQKSSVARIENRPELNQVLAFIHTGSRRQFTPNSKSGLARARIFTFNPGTPKKTDEDPITRLLVDVARSDGQMASSLASLREILNQEFSQLKMLLPIKTEVYGGMRLHIHREYVPFEEWMKGGELKKLEHVARIDHYRPLRFVDQAGSVRSLSLGQLSFIKFILTALANAGPSSAFIIDEPESFLHPNLISRFMRTLNKILDSTFSIAIIATHSPYVVREVQNAQVHVIREQNSVTTVDHPRLQTLGANVASISNEVFGDDLPHHLYEELISHARDTSQSFADALEKYSNELSTEALMKLRIIMAGSDEKN